MDLYHILNTVQNSLYAGIIFIALLYSCLILFLRRFHHRNNIFICNMCINIIFSCIYFINYFQVIYSHIEPSVCIILNYAFNIASIEIPFAFVTFTIHRFCSIIYPTKPLFKKKRWVTICISTQWISQFLISLPFVFRQYDHCHNKIWIAIYTLSTAVVLPMLVNIVLNICIFIHVRRSSRRVQPQIVNVLTSGTSNQQPRINRRDIYLLKQMIFMFTMFIVGWTPILIINIVDAAITTDVNPLIIMMAMYLSELCIFGIAVNLFMCNHDVKEYLLNKIRHCICH